MDKIDAYKEILNVLNRHEDLLKEDYSINIIDKVNNRIAIQEISKSFGITIKPDCNPDWCKLSEYANIGIWGW